MQNMQEGKKMTIKLPKISPLLFSHTLNLDMTYQNLLFFSTIIIIIF